MLAVTVAQRSNFIVGLSITIIGLALVIALSLWIFKTRSSQKYNSELKMTRSPTKSYFDFLKRNFLIFLDLFFLVMTISGFAMFITSLS